MNYNYYKNKYKTISIKLDRQKDADIIKYFDDMAAQGSAAKQTICGLVRQDLITQSIVNSFCKIEVMDDD